MISDHSCSFIYLHLIFSHAIIVSYYHWEIKLSCTISALNGYEALVDTNVDVRISLHNIEAGKSKIIHSIALNYCADNSYITYLYVLLIADYVRLLITLIIFMFSWMGKFYESITSRYFNYDIVFLHEKIAISMWNIWDTLDVQLIFWLV